MELFVSEDSWKNCSKYVKDLLNTFILQAKDYIEKSSIEFINKRYNIYKTQKPNDYVEGIKNLKHI